MSCVFASASARRGHQQVEAAFADPLEAGRREQRGDRPAAAARAALRVAVAKNGVSSLTDSSASRRTVASIVCWKRALLESRSMPNASNSYGEERARSQLEPPVRDRVELRGLGRELDRMMERRLDAARHQADRLRLRAARNISGDGL